MGFNETNGEYGIYIMGIHDWRITEHQLEKKLESLRITGDNSVEYTCEKVCYALNKSLG